MEQDVENEYRTVCSTCLSSDRDLFALNNINVPQAFQIFKLLMYDFAGDRLGEMAEISHLICWECLALMKRFHKFKWQVHNAQEHIRVIALSQETMDHTYMSQSLSTLVVETKSDYDKIYFDYTIPDCQYIVTDGMDVKSEQFVSLKDTIGLDVEEHILEVPEIVLDSNSQVFSHVVLGSSLLSADTYNVKPELMPSLTIKPMTAANLEAGTVILSQQPSKTEMGSPGYTTEYMSEADMLASREEAKKKVSYASSVYKCELCAIGFYTQQQVEQHFETQHRPKPGLVACKLCYLYIEETSLASHVRQHYMRYRCKMCSHTEYSERLMQIHTKSHLTKSVPNAVIKIEGSGDKKRKLIILRNKYRRRIRDASDPLKLPDTEFVANFRLSKAGYRKLYEEIQPYLPLIKRKTAVRDDLKVLAALYFFANGSHQRKMGDSVLWNMSQASFCKCLHDVTNALNHRNILLKYIKFPNTKQARQNVMKGFMDKHRFPGVIGCVTGTHVNIVCPDNNNRREYLNKLEKHSLNVLIISDVNLNILHVDASFGGASKDADVWEECPLKDYLEKIQKDGEKCWLLGDARYEQTPSMMTPILNPQNAPEEYYNEQHNSTIDTVQACIGVLKSRWRCILTHKVLYYDPITAARIINACVVLHNFANTLNLAFPELENVDDFHRNEVFGDVQDGARDELVQRLWEDRNEMLE